MKTAKQYIQNVVKSILALKKYQNFKDKITEEEFELYDDCTELVKRLNSEGLECKEIENIYDLEIEEKPFLIVITPDDDVLTSYDLVVEFYEERYDSEWENFIVVYSIQD